MIDIDRLANAGRFDHVLDVTAERGVVGQATKIALEEAIIARIEAHECHEQAQIRLREPAAEKERPPTC